jgi:hypothetical protein
MLRKLSRWLAGLKELEFVHTVWYEARPNLGISLGSLLSLRGYHILFS